MRCRSGLKTIPAASTTPAAPATSTTPTTPTTPTPAAPATSTTSTTPAGAAEIRSCALNRDLLQVFVAQIDKINKLFGEFAIGSIFAIGRLHMLLSLSVRTLNCLLRRSMLFYLDLCKQVFTSCLHEKYKKIDNRYIYSFILKAHWHFIMVACMSIFDPQNRRFLLPNIHAQATYYARQYLYTLHIF